MKRFRTTDQQSSQHAPLYTAEQRARRDASRWTFVQGVLAPVQFLIFLISLVLVIRFLMTGQGENAAVASVLLKTVALYTIMITGALWEHDVYGRYLFAPAFWWEDAVSMVVIALHTLYVGLWLFDIGGTTMQMGVALAAYATYVVNAGQFVWKLRQARLSAAAAAQSTSVPTGSSPRNGDPRASSASGASLGTLVEPVS